VLKRPRCKNCAPGKHLLTREAQACGYLVGSVVEAVQRQWKSELDTPDLKKDRRDWENQTTGVSQIGTTGNRVDLESGSSN